MCVPPPQVDNLIPFFLNTVFPMGLSFFRQGIEVLQRVLCILPPFHPFTTRTFVGGHPFRFFPPPCIPFPINHSPPYFALLRSPREGVYLYHRFRILLFIRHYRSFFPPWDFKSFLCSPCFNYSRCDISTDIFFTRLTLGPPPVGFFRPCLFPNSSHFHFCPLFRLCVGTRVCFTTFYLTNFFHP